MIKKLAIYALIFFLGAGTAWLLMTLRADKELSAIGDSQGLSSFRLQNGRDFIEACSNSFRGISTSAVVENAGASAACYSVAEFSVEALLDLGFECFTVEDYMKKRYGGTLIPYYRNYFITEVIEEIKMHKGEMQQIPRALFTAMVSLGVCESKK